MLTTKPTCVGQQTTGAVVRGQQQFPVRKGGEERRGKGGAKARHKRRSNTSSAGRGWGRDRVVAAAGPLSFGDMSLDFNTIGKLEGAGSADPAITTTTPDLPSEAPSTSALDSLPKTESPATTFEAPKIEMPDMPDMPKIEVPKFEMPKDMPKFEVPKFEMPKNLPKIEVPKFEVPDMPKMPDMPEMPKIEAPQMDAAPQVPEVPSSTETAPTLDITPAPAPAPSVETPQVEMPEMTYKIEPPKIDMPEMPDMPDMPDMPEMPKIEVPKFEMPKFGLPKFEVPDMPKMEVPKLEVPEMPKIEAPQMDAAPQVPEVPSSTETAPTLDITPAPTPAPSVETPQVEMPEMTYKIEPPKIDLPKDTPNNIEAPQLEMPKIEMPKVDIPKIEIPKVEIPKVEIPKVEIPSFDLGSTASNIKGQILDYVHSLPLPQEVNSAVDTSLNQDPQVYQYIAQIGIPLLVFSLWNGTYGGFSGYARPEKILDELLTEDSNSVLIDIRNDEERGDDGIPELKFGARGKVAAIPLQKLGVETLSQVRTKATKLQIDLTSLVIRNLAMLNPRTTKIYLMTGNTAQTNGSGKDLARKLRSMGCRKIYLMEGGFKEWVQEGLPISNKSANYEKGTIKVVADKAEIFVGGASQYLTDPLNAAGAVTAAGLSAFALFNYDYVLQYIGVVGLMISFGLYALDFDTPEELASDLGKKYSSAKDQSEKLSKAASEVKNTLQRKD